MAGHSKWANIKHKKGRADAARGKIFSKIAKEILVAAAAGGGNPDDNITLRALIQKAKAANPDVITVMGGPHATVDVDTFLDSGAMDYVIGGEAEMLIEDHVDVALMVPV